MFISSAAVSFLREPQPAVLVLGNIINQAERYVYITTPYLIIDYELTEAIRGAARRGVDVRIITPHIADKKLVKLMTKSAYPYLIEGGVSIYEYTPGFIHEKLILCDSEYAIFGTINLDYRSLAHHFEDAVWIYSSPVLKDMEHGFLKTLGRSQKLKKADAGLSPPERLLRSLIRLFAPLL